MKGKAFAKLNIALVALMLVLAIGIMPIEGNSVHAAKKKLSSENVTLSKTTYNLAFTKDGNLKVQKPTVKVKYGKKVLKKGKDYTLSYSDKYSDEAAVDSYYVTVKGKGKYKGTVYKYYKINPATLSASKVFLECDKDFFFNGSKQTPKASDLLIGYKTGVKGGNDYYLTRGDEYKIISGPTVSKSDWKKTGVAKVTVKIKGLWDNDCEGNFKGTTTVTGKYYIYPTKPKLVSIKGDKGKFTIKWNAPKGDFDKYRLHAYHRKSGDIYYDYINKTKTEFTMVGINNGLLPSGTYDVFLTPVMKDSPYLYHECPGEITTTVTVN